MKRTLSIDTDVLIGIERYALRHDLDFDDAVNELLRVAISGPGFVVKSRSLGQPLLPVDLDKISSVLSDLDEAEGRFPGN
ncbi:MAG: hypothetical protein IPK58_09720 [Acidobacteria bacterium]|nr:hypothetical protein [Acidobacteriota bacterium]